MKEILAGEDKVTEILEQDSHTHKLVEYYINDVLVFTSCCYLYRNILNLKQESSKLI